MAPRQVAEHRPIDRPLSLKGGTPPERCACRWPARRAQLLIKPDKRTSLQNAVEATGAFYSTQNAPNRM